MLSAVVALRASYVGRSALGSLFLSGGYLVLRDPARPVEGAETFLNQLKGRVPPLRILSNLQLVRLNAAVMCLAGGSLVAGRMPRISAALLVGTMVPTTLAAFPFWQKEHGPERMRLYSEFMKNFAITGSLITVVCAPKAD